MYNNFTTVPRHRFKTLIKRNMMRMVD